MRAGVVQMSSGSDVAANLAAAERLVQEAAAAGCGLVVLPENFALMPRQDADRLASAEADGGGPLQEFLALTALRERVYLVGGTVPMLAAQGGRARSACLLYGPDGERLARYDKVHLFDVSLPNGEEYRESDTVEPGSEPVVVDTPYGRLGLAICYDVRFPELFRRMLDQGAELFAIPSAFTRYTGQAHWEVLLRARAVENLAYVLGAAQGGRHDSGRETFGHSMIVDPWGGVLGEIAAGTGVATAVIDRTQQQQVRRSLPSIGHRRF